MVNLCSNTNPRPKPLLTKCKWRYATSLKPVFKGEKLQENKIVTLCCRNTHCIRLCYKEYKEEDLFHLIFSKYARQEIPFMCRWLYHFVTENYDSDATVVYWPLESDNYTKQDKFVITDKNKELDMKPKRRIIRAHPSRGGFVVSIHGVCKRRNQTYVGCKV